MAISGALPPSVEGNREIYRSKLESANRQKFVGAV